MSKTQIASNIFQNGARAQAAQHKAGLFAAAAALLTLSAQTVFAALPPLYQTQREIVRLISDEQFTKMVDSSQGIVKIEAIDDNSYRVTLSDQCTIKAKRVVTPQQHPGPLQFSFDFGPLVCPLKTKTEL